MVKELLALSESCDEDILKHDEDQNTALHVAVHGGNPVILEELTSNCKFNGATVDICNPRNGDTPLHVAVRRAAESDSGTDIRMVQLLIDAGANPNRKNASRETPVSLAHSNATLLELVVRENLRRLDYPERLLFMLHQGKVDKIWTVVLNIAVIFGHVSLLKCIFHLDNEETKTVLLEKYMGSNAFERAVCGNDFTVFRLLLEKLNKPEIDLPNTSGQTPLHLAMQCLNLSQAVFLIASGAYPFLETPNEKTPAEVLNEFSGAEHFQQSDKELLTAGLHFFICVDVQKACSNNTSNMNDLVSDFIGYFKSETFKSNILMQHTPTGDTALHAVVKTENYEVLQLLLDCLDQPDECNVQNVDGETPLQICLNQMNRGKETMSKIAELLLDQGADPQQVSLSQLVALKSHRLLHKVLKKLIPRLGIRSIIEKTNDLEVAQTIAVAGLQIGCKAGKAIVVKHLLESSTGTTRAFVTTSIDPFTGEGAAHAAVRGGSVSVLRHVLGHGGPAAAKCINALGQTPLHFALAQGDVEMVMTLEAAGAVHTSDNTGAGSFHFAARASSDSSLKYLCQGMENQELLQEVLNSATCLAGLTPLHYAAWNNSEEVVEWLLRHGAVPSLQIRDRVEQALPWQWAVMGSQPNDSLSTASLDSLFLLLDFHVQNKMAFFPEENPQAWYKVFQRFKDHEAEEAFALLSLWMLAFKMDLISDESLAKRLEPGLLACLAAYGDATANMRLARVLKAAVGEDREMVEKLVTDSHLLEWAGRRAENAETLKIIEPLLQVMVEERFEAQLKNAFTYSFEEKNDRRLFREALGGYCQNSAAGSLMIKEVIKEEAKRVAGWKVGKWMLNLPRFEQELFEGNPDKLEDDVPLAYWIALMVTYSKEFPMDAQLSCYWTIYLSLVDTHESNMQNIKQLVKRVDEFGDRFIQGYPNEKGRYTGRTALHWATIFDQQQIVGALREKGVKDHEKWRNCRADVFDDFGKPPYWYAGSNKELLNHLKWDGYTDSLKNDRDLLVDALNAILVAAALISSVTFNGILNPPLGFFFKLGNQVQADNALQYVGVNIKGITAFWACNNLSFFFAMTSALAAVIGLFPSQYENFDYKNLRNKLVTAALSLLASIICVLLAFATASFSDLPPLFRYRAINLCTLTIGGLFFFGVLLWFRSSLNYLLPKSAWLLWQKLMTKNCWQSPQLAVKHPKPKPLSELLEAEVCGPRYTRTGDAPWEDGLDNVNLAASQPVKLDHTICVDDTSF